ncbi:MAG: CopG family transcriptional regulator [Bacillota bacterium]|nr:CopG family transcriptional regulator [Bacillota bacterium]
MIRKQLYIPKSQDALLKQRAVQWGVSEAELVRQAVESYLAPRIHPPRDLSAWEREKAFISARAEELEGMGEPAGWKREEIYDGRRTG